jgi:hypothetical protein
MCFEQDHDGPGSPKKPSPRLVAPFFTGDRHGFLLRSYGYVCKGKNKATNAIRAVKTIAKARADRAAGRQVLVGDSVNYGLSCIQVLSQRYTKTTQCIQMVCSWWCIGDHSKSHPRIQFLRCEQVLNGT